MINNNNDLSVTEGEEIQSILSFDNKNDVNEIDKKEQNVNNFINQEEKKKSNDFTDLSEINNPEKIFINQYNNQKSISNIDSIELLNKDPNINFIYKPAKNNVKIVESKKNLDNKLISNIEDKPKEEHIQITEIKEDIQITEIKKEEKKDEQIQEKQIKKDKKYSLKKFKKEKKEENIIINDQKTTDNINLTTEKKEQSPELPKERELKDIDEIEFLISNIDKDNENVKYPGKIYLTSIDSSLTNNDFINEKAVEPVKEIVDEEIFGVKRSEIFSNIDKQIYASRTTKSLDLKKVKGIKSGLMLPFMVSIISFSTLILALPILLIYFKKQSTISLEENVYKDSSILAKIAKQKEEEAKRAQQRLDEERKRLENEKNRLESIISEELRKKQAEIENLYKSKYAELQKQNLDPKELEALRKQLEEEKKAALNKAEEEKRKEKEERERLLSMKDQAIKEAESKLNEQLKNKEFEILNITKSFQEQLREKEKERENISLRLKELNEINLKIKEFNAFVYQLIQSAIDEFKQNNIDAGLLKFESILKYYESRIDFVNSNPELKTKMITDIFFINTIKKFVEEIKGSSIYNKEFNQIVAKYKKLLEFYKNGEDLYKNKEFRKANEEYLKVLQEFDEINFSFKKIKNIDKQLQNIIASDYFNKAIENIKLKKYDLALNQLSAIIKEAPDSDWTIQALNNILTLANTLSSETKTQNANIKAKELYNLAEKYTSENRFKEAIDLYSEIITNYSYSDYTGKSYLNCLSLLKNLYTEEGKINIENILREKFRANYIKYLDSYKSGDFIKARDFYYNALGSAFNIYADNSILDFKKIEDDYFNSILNMNNKNLLEVLEKTKKELTDQFEKELNSKKEYYEKIISDLKKELQEQKDKMVAEREKLKQDYQKLLDSKIIDKKQFDDMKNYYDSLISEKNKEIEDLKNKYITKEEYDRMKKELQDEIERLKNENKKLQDSNLLSGKDKEELKNYYEKIIAQKNNEIENLKKMLANKDEIENLRKQLQQEIDALKKERDELNYKNELSNKQIESLRNYYEELISNKNKEIEDLKKQIELSKESLAIREQLENEIKRLNKEIYNEKNNTIKIKEQLIDSYKKYSELEKRNNELESLTKTKDLSKEYTELKKKYDELEKEFKKYKDNEISRYKDIEKDFNNKLNEELNKQKEELQNKFNKEIDRLRSLIDSQINIKKIEDKKQSGSKKDIKKYIARIIEINNNIVSFQLLSSDLFKSINKGDIVKVIKIVYENDEKKEEISGEIEITSISDKSNFGRGKIITNNNIKENDLLVK